MYGSLIWALDNQEPIAGTQESGRGTILGPMVRTLDSKYPLPK